MNSEEFLKKIREGDRFDECELRELAFGESGDGIYWIDDVEGEEHRWQREIQTIIKVENLYFAIDWMKALTECQESDFDCQPYLVTKKKVMVEKILWEPVQTEHNSEEV